MRPSPIAGDGLAGSARTGGEPNAPQDGTAAVRLRNVGKSVASGDGTTQVLTDVSLQVQPGEFVAILGVSGSGKSTLLNLIGAMDAPTRGTVEVFGRDLSALDEGERTAFRRDHLGFVFQFFNLLSTMTVAENVMIGMEHLGIHRDELVRRTRHYLDAVGLGAKADRFPSQLSGGEQQRVAIARALAKQPLLVLADEPTGNLDRATARSVLALMRSLNRSSGVTFLVVTHDEEVSGLADRAFHLGEGGAVPDGRTAPARVEGIARSREERDPK